MRILTRRDTGLLTQWTFGTSAIDPDAIAFIVAAGITDLTQEIAIVNLVSSLKSNNLWSKMKALYPFVGGNATAHSYNLINVAQYQLTFMGGGTHSSLGYVGNGTTGYAKTGIIPNNVFTPNNLHFSYYSQTSTASSSGCDIGVYPAPRGPIELHMLYNSTTSVAYVNSSSGSVPATTGKRYMVASRDSSTTISATNNGVTTSGISSNSNSNLSLIEIYIHALNNQGTPGSYSNRTSSLVSFGQSLSSSEAQTLSTIVNTYQTTLSRNVY